MALERGTEVRHIHETAVCYFRNAPAGLPQQNFGFLGKPVPDEGRRGVARGFFEHPIEVVHMHSQLIGKIGRGAQAQLLTWILQWKLSLQQVGKLRRQPVCRPGR